MSAAFTPGPWDAVWWAAVLRDLHNFLPDELREGEGDPRYLYPGLSTFQSEQDARLIAAAPTNPSSTQGLSARKSRNSRALSRAPAADVAEVML